MSHTARTSASPQPMQQQQPHAPHSARGAGPSSAAQASSARSLAQSRAGGPSRAGGNGGAEESKEAAAHPEPDYSSNGCSVEETRAERYTPEFIRALTPRSKHACMQEGVLPEELLFRPLHSFDGAAAICSTAGVIAAVGAEDSPSPSASAAAQQIQHLRWKDYESSRAVALLRVRTTRRRVISGLRHTLFGIAAKTKDGGAIPAREALELSQAHQQLLQQQQQRSHARGSSGHLPSITSRPSERTLSQTHPHAQSSLHLHESPLFKDHPLHDRFASTAGATGTASAATLPGAGTGRTGKGARHTAVEWGSDDPGHGTSGHVCGRMREHLAREQERAEWEAAEAKREARAQRKRELKENEWYRQRKAALDAATAAAAAGASTAANPSLSGSQSARSVNASKSNKNFELSGPRTTRAHLLRTGCGVGLVAAQSAAAGSAAAQPGSGSNSLGSTLTAAHNASFSAALNGDSKPVGLDRKGSVMPSASVRSLGANAGVGGTSSASLPVAASPSMVPVPSTLVSNGGANNAYLQSDLSASFAARVQSSVAQAAAHYSAFFDSAAQKIVARQEMEIRQLAVAEAVRAAAQKKQDELARKRAERARVDRLRREAESLAAQKSREAKFARVEAEEAARVARFEGAWAARLEKTESIKAEREQERAARIAARQVEEEQIELARKERVALAYKLKQDRLAAMAQAAADAFEASKARVAAEQLALRQSKEHAHERLRAEKALAAAQLAQEACETKLREHTRRVEAHAARDHSSHVAAAHTAGRMRRIESRQVRESNRAEVLSAGKEQVELRAASLERKAAQDEERVRHVERERAESLLLSTEKKRLELARKERNLEREQRKLAFAQAQREEKLAGDLARLEAIEETKRAYASQRAAFAKHAFREVEEFRATYAKLRTQGALTKITREAKQRQKEIDLQHEMEQA